MSYFVLLDLRDFNSQRSWILLWLNSVTFPWLFQSYISCFNSKGDFGSQRANDLARNYSSLVGLKSALTFGLWFSSWSSEDWLLSKISDFSVETNGLYLLP